MRRISVERYRNPQELGYSGLVEGVRDDGSSWIMWLDENGSPALYWARRDEGGGVIGEPIDLAVEPDQ